MIAGRKLTVWWGPGHDQSDSGLTPEEVDRLLNRLEGEASAAPFLVDVVDETEATLTIGLGRPVTVLSFIASIDPPYLTTYAAEPVVQDSVWFDYGGSESEFVPDQVIPLELARRVARAFAENGDRSGVDWQEA